MKKIYFFIILLFITGSIFSCKNSSDSDTTTIGYENPGVGTVLTQALKSYQLGGFSCATSKTCGAIIYQGYLNYTYYAGFAVDNYTAAGSGKFTLKIYWNASSLASINTTSFTVTINDDTYIYTTPVAPDDNLNITISSGTDANGITVYNIVFLEDLTVTDGSGHNFTISSGTDSITAYKND